MVTTEELKGMLGCGINDPFIGDDAGDTISMKTTVSETPNSIGYISAAFVRGEESVNVVALDNGLKKGVPSIENIRNNSCATIRDLYFYIPKSTSTQPDLKSRVVNLLARWVNADEGKRIVSQHGFVTTN